MYFSTILQLLNKILIDNGIIHYFCNVNKNELRQYYICLTDNAILSILYQN